MKFLVLRSVYNVEIQEEHEAVVSGCQSSMDWSLCSYTLEPQSASGCLQDGRDVTFVHLNIWPA